ncbi:MAG: hypothetical protein IJ009_06620 [Clostridia bacterium]|nr:hypothetical protein [Clostridia bacterium]
MSWVTYGVSEEVYTSATNRRTSYGIVAYAEDESISTIVASFRDVSSDKEKVEQFVGLCNRMKLSLDHFSDAVEDFIAK